MEQQYKEEDDYGEETQEMQGVRPMARHDKQQGLQTMTERRNDTGWERHSANTVLCTICGDYVTDTTEAMLAHFEKTETHNGAKITPCDAKRISSDGP